MKIILGFIRNYFREADKTLLALCCFFIALCIFINYYHGLNRRISTYTDWQQFISWYLVFIVVFSFAYIAGVLLKKADYFKKPGFISLLLIAPGIFAWKMSYNVHFIFTEDVLANSYWNQVVYWPFKLLIIIFLLWITWRIFDRHQPFYGTLLKQFRPGPYLWMLLIMVPLIAAASTQQDFLAVYPKLKNVLYLSEQHDSGFYKLLYELSYGSDFIGIELFFRGFLVLAFIKFAGRDAILPMALFYCTIHFGKPLGECISSFFGGLILGIITYHTRSIYGGLIVHLGIAWMMELAGMYPLSS